MEQCVIYCFCIFYFWFFGDNWFLLALAGFLMSLVTTLMTLFVPESPRLLMAHGKLEETKSAIDTLAWWNGKTIEWSKIELERHVG